MESQHEFNPQSIKLARTARKVSQTALAKKLGVSQPLVSQWEDGIKAPSEDSIQSLSRELDFPREFFFLRIQHFGPGVGEVFHRRRKITEGEKSAYYCWASIKSSVISTLLEPIDWPDHDLMIADAFDLDDAIAAAKMTRARWSLPMGPIRSMSDILASAGVLVVPEWDVSDAMDGMSVWRNGQPPTIFVNARMPVDRIRFTLAHELGHLILHHKSEIYDLSEAVEDQANAFASEFLMPAAEIRPQLKSINHRTLTLLKKHWKVSRAALVMRAKTLGVLSGSAAEQIWRDMSKRGWRKSEPDPLNIDSEQVDLSIKEILKLNESIGRVSKSTIRSKFGISSDDFSSKIFPVSSIPANPFIRSIK